MLMTGLWRAVAPRSSGVVGRRPMSAPLETDGEKMIRVCDSSPRVALLYATSDDFNPVALKSVSSQRGIAGDLFVLDDSQLQSSRMLVDATIRTYPAHVIVLRRENRSGFKA